MPNSAQYLPIFTEELFLFHDVFVIVERSGEFVISTKASAFHHYLLEFRAPSRSFFIILDRILVKQKTCRTSIKYYT